MLSVNWLSVCNSMRLTRIIRVSASSICSTSFQSGRHYSVNCANKQSSEPVNPLKRSYLYVPAASDRMLTKSVGVGADVLIYDLEDSVPPSATDKVNARLRLKKFLQVCFTSSLYSNVSRFMSCRTVQTPCRHCMLL